MAEAFKLPETHSVSVEVDGVHHQGDWCVMLKELVVYFHGFALSCKVPERDLELNARAMLEKLVQQHYTPKSALVGKVPEALLPAAYNYLNVFDDDQSVHGFVSAFGELTTGSLAYQQVAWLANYATGLVVPFWKHMCDGDAPEQIHSRLQAWLLDPTTEVDWETACTPCIASRSGEQVVDCDACRLEPIAEAVSSLANYLQTADPEMAATCLSAASSAFNEGCHPRALSDGFERWLVFEALPHAMKLEPPSAAGL